MPIPTIFSAARPVTSLPSTVTLPALGRISPAIALSRVDLPAPLGPTMAVIAPSRATMLTPLITGGPPYPAVRFSTTRTVGARSGLSVTDHLAQVRVDHGLARAQGLERALGDHGPLGHDDHVLGHAFDERQVVFHDDDRGPGGDESFDGHGHALAHHRVDASHRLIEDDELGLGHADSRKLDQALLPAAEAARPLVADGVESKLRDDLARPGPLFGRRGALPPPESENPLKKALATGVPTRHDDVLDHGQRRPLSRRLKRANETQAGDPVGRESFELAPFEQDRPGIGKLEAGDQIDRRALACAVRSDESRDLAQRRLKRAVLHRVHATEVLGQAADLERGGDGRNVQVAWGAGSTAGSRSMYRRSGSRPCGRNRRNSTSTSPMIAPRSASTTWG